MEAVGFTRLGYRRPLDGVRAVAVGMVMLVHTNRTILPNGDLGVDIFFVLSGFLITTLLLEEAALTHGIALGKFYARRALRLFPAVFFMLAVVSLGALLFASPHTRHTLLGEVAATALYVRNWAWMWHVPADGYLGHAWSLSLEEQFYVVWPALLYFGFIRPKRESLLPAALIAILLVFAVMRITSTWRELLVQRPDALFVGCLAAVLLARRNPELKPTNRWDWLRGGACVGAIGVVAAALAPATAHKFFNHGGYLLIAAGAVLFIVDLVRAPDSAIAQLLSEKPFVFIGRISYALYLWHLPVYRAFRAANLGLSNVVDVAAKVGVTFVLATASYYFIERRALRLKARLNPLYEHADKTDWPGTTEIERRVDI
jgi:peptidoglycan/LPS O-acetylase OafA/YrhL